MRYLILALGTRGDVQPFVALGRGLQRAGHAVRLAADAHFAGMVRDYGLDFAPLTGDVRAIMDSPTMQEVFAKGRNPVRLVRAMTREMRPIAHQLMTDVLHLSGDTEAIILGSLAFLAGFSVCEKLGLPGIPAFLQPLNPTRKFVNPLWPGPALGRLYNYLSHYAVFGIFWQLMRPAINDFRRNALGLPKAGWRGPLLQDRWRKAPTLYGYSPVVLPRPSDYGPNIHVTGYWFLEAQSEWQPPAALQRFLEAGDPPVYIGFGSMNSNDPQATTDLMVEALQMTGQRGILLTGWGALGQRPLPPSIHTVESIPHDWLFPRCAAVVHHGGAGTVAAGLRAGRPTVVIPFFSDQPFWGRCVYKLGAGPKPIFRHKLTAQKLAAALEFAAQPPTQARAAEVGALIRAEDGVGQAVRAIAGGH